MRSSTNMTQGGQTGAVFYPNGEYEQTITAEGKLTENVRTTKNVHLRGRVSFVDFF